MKKKLLCFVLALCLIIPCALFLTACDLLGGDEEDVAYNLEVRAVIVNGETKTPFQVTNIGELKAETDDGQYIGGNGYDLRAPKENKYKFIGWYNDEGNLISVLHRVSKWNMYDRDGYIEARYEPLEYDVTFVVDEIDSRIQAHYNCVTEQLTFNGEEPKKVDSIPSPYEVGFDIDGYSFENWYYFDNTQENPEVNCSAFPESEDVVEGGFLALFANIQESPKPSYTVNLNLNGLTVDTTRSENIDTTKTSLSIEEGTEIKIHIDVSIGVNGYQFDKFIIETNSGTTYETSNVLEYTITEDVTITAEIGVKYGVMVYIEVDNEYPIGEQLFGDDKYYIFVDQEMLNKYADDQHPAPTLWYSTKSSSLPMDVTRFANDGLYFANKIIGTEDAYEVDMDKSRLTNTIQPLVGERSEYDNLLIIVYAIKE